MADLLTIISVSISQKLLFSQLIGDACTTSINYARCILDDTQKIHYFHNEYLANGQTFLYCSLNSRLNSFSEFKNIALKKMRENYWRNTKHRFIGLVEHDGIGEDYHCHAVVIPDANYSYTQLADEVREQWIKAGGYRKSLVKPQPIGVGNGPLGMLFYMCKATNKDDLAVKPIGTNGSNLIYCNFGKELPWHEKPLPSQHIYRPSMPEIAVNYFKKYRANPDLGIQATIPSVLQLA